MLYACLRVTSTVFEGTSALSSCCESSRDYTWKAPCAISSALAGGDFRVGDEVMLAGGVMQYVLKRQVQLDRL